MRHIEEVFNYARALRAKPVRSGENSAKTRLLCWSESGRRVLGLTQANPDDPMMFLGSEGGSAGSLWRLEAWMGRYPDASATWSVLPCVIRTHHALRCRAIPGIANDAERKASAAVYTKIAPAVNSLLRTPENKIETQNSSREELPWLDLPGPRDCEPLFEEPGIPALKASL
jgi:hypothetical protein